jgi:hypothetical protein
MTSSLSITSVKCSSAIMKTLTAKTSKRRMSTSRTRATVGQAVWAPMPNIVGVQMAVETKVTRASKLSESRTSKASYMAIVTMTAHTTVEAMVMGVSTGPTQSDHMTRRLLS